MEPDFRHFSLDEKYFKAPLKIHIPYSVPPESLPMAVVPPPPPVPPIDLSRDQFPDNNFGDKAGKFLRENWQILLSTIIITVALRYALDEYSKHTKRKKTVEYTNFNDWGIVIKPEAKSIKSATYESKAEKEKNENNKIAGDTNVSVDAANHN